MKPTAYKNFFIYKDGATRINYTATPVIHDSIDKVLPLYEIDFTKFKLMPRNPTKEIKQAISKRLWDLNDPDETRVYKDGIEAAPKIEDIP